jgi:hypothetical protein
MRTYLFRWLCGAAGLLLLGIPLWGQAGMERTASGDAKDEPRHLGYPQDWSSRHLLMPGARTEDVMAAAERDPRYVYNLVMRRVAVENARTVPSAHTGIRMPLRRRRMKIDWAVSLEKGYVPQNQFPAKYQFGVGAENCNSDYVLFGLTVTAGVQANLVGINNLYTTGSPACNGGSPWVAFAYNTVTQAGGQIRTSPTLSIDGTKVAFVESTGGASYFHVLVLPNPIPVPPSQTGTVLSPQTPTSCATPTTPSCMTTLTIESSATNSNSSPWVDYASDTVYVGADNGVLYKITPVFGGGAPALVNSGGWPVTVSTQPTKVLTAPVVDDTAGRIFIGDGEGYLYAVSLASPGGTYAARVEVGWATHGAGTGVVDPPIAVTDSANPATDQVFVFTGCSIVNGIGGAVSQLPANFTSASTLTINNTVDLGSGSGNGDCTGGNVHSGTFDNAFWLNGSTSGHMIACGFVSGTVAKPRKPSNPKMFFFPFASNVITSTGSSTFVVNNTKGDECSPLTEFYDGTTDRMFFGVGSGTDGFLESSTITSSLTTPTCAGSPTSSCVTSPSALGGTSGIVIDNQVSNGGTNIYFSTLAAGSVNSQKCNVSGGTANPYCAVRLTQAALQ